MDATYIPYIAAAIAFGSVLLLGYGIVGYFTGTSDTARLKQRIAGNGATNGATSSAALDDLKNKVSGVMENVGAKIAPTDSEEIDKTQTALIQAGLRDPGAALKFQGAKGGLALVLLAMVLAARFIALPQQPLATTMFLSVAALAIGIYGPGFWLQKKVAARQLLVANELPDALDLLVVCVESGMGLDQAIERVQNELRTSAPTISHELKILTLELRAGKARADALRALSNRVGQDDLASLASMLIQADVFGISVGRTLRVYSDAMRTKRSQRAEEKAAKLPVLLLLPLVTFILPALFIAIMGPAVILFIDIFAKVNG